MKRAGAQFSRPPIGPLGQHLVLEDARWVWRLQFIRAHTAAAVAWCMLGGNHLHVKLLGPLPTVTRPRRCATLCCCRWGRAAEAALGLQLEAWLCHSMADAHRLRTIIGHCFAGGWGRELGVQGV